MARAFGAQLALMTFAATTLNGVLCGTDAISTLMQALIQGGLLGIVGLVCGDLARRTVEESARAEFDRWLAELPVTESSVTQV